MNTVQIWETTSTSLENTLELAAQVGRRLHGGEVIELVGDLGSGKTAFVRGLAQGLGVENQVHSPSFTLSNEYQAGKCTLHHFDFYRLAQPGIMRQELAEVLDDPQAVTVIEWPEIVENILPADRLTINLRASGETNRQLVFKYPPDLDYLIPKT